MKRMIKNNSGSVLIEVLAGMAIMSIMAIAFSATIMQANFLFVKATFVSREWEKVFNKVERKEYVTTPVPMDGAPFQIQIQLEPVLREDIVLADGTAYGATEEMVAGRADTTLIPPLKFRQYEEIIESAQSPGTETVHVYRIME